MRKICNVFLLIIVFVLVGSLSSFADVSVNEYTSPYFAKYTVYADRLKDIGIMAGTDKGLDLESFPTRAQAATMVVRMLGKVEEAKALKYTAPFKDVPEWAKPYVNYMYVKGWSNGISKDQFGADNLIKYNEFVTFSLRVLGYTSGTDFDWSKPYKFAGTVGLMDKKEEYVIPDVKFNRGDMAYLVYQTITAAPKGTNILVIQNLIESGVINKEKAVNNKMIIDYSNMTKVDEINITFNKAAEKWNNYSAVFDVPKGIVGDYQYSINLEVPSYAESIDDFMRFTIPVTQFKRDLSGIYDPINSFVTYGNESVLCFYDSDFNVKYVAFLDEIVEGTHTYNVYSAESGGVLESYNRVKAEMSEVSSIVGKFNGEIKIGKDDIDTKLVGPSIVITTHFDYDFYISSGANSLDVNNFEFIVKQAWAESLGFNSISFKAYPKQETLDINSILVRSYILFFKSDGTFVKYLETDTEEYSDTKYN